jgi:hypothetical protein
MTRPLAGTVALATLPNGRAGVATPRAGISAPSALPSPSSGSTSGTVNLSPVGRRS